MLTDIITVSNSNPYYNLFNTELFLKHINKLRVQYSSI